MAMLRPLKSQRKNNKLMENFVSPMLFRFPQNCIQTEANTNNIKTLCKQGRLREAIHLLEHPLHSSSSSYVDVLQACIEKKALPEGRLIHAHLNQTGCISDRLLRHTLVNMYSKCRRLMDARRVFDEMPNRFVSSWTIMIGAYTRHEIPEEALVLFHQMQSTGFEPDQYTFSSVLPACTKLEALQQGMKIHEDIVKGGFLSDIVVGNVLIDMYAKCGSVENARDVFDKMRKRDVVTWTTMITGYAKNGWGVEGLKLFQEMKKLGVKPNLKTFASILPVCANLAALEQGVEIHEEIVNSGLQCDVFVESSLVDMYAKCGNIEEALTIFGKMQKRDTVSWTVIIGGCAQNGMEEEALRLFLQMKLAGMKPIAKTFANVLPACANLASLEQGMQIHKGIIRTGFEHDVFVANALIDMYAKCGSITRAQEVFDKMGERNVSSWTAMIAGYGMHGFGKEALQLFEQMDCSGIKPDSVSLVCVLTACCHAGLVDEGYRYFNLMNNCYHITPTMEHYCSMVDLFGRSGRLDEARDFIGKMPIKPDATVWRCLLSACRTRNNIELGELAANHLFELEPKNAAPYVLLSNMYAAAGRREDNQKVRRMMKDRGVKKTPGCSWIEVDKTVHTFLVSDTSHPQAKAIYAELEKLAREMKSAGYVPDTSFVLHEAEEQKEGILCKVPTIVRSSESYLSYYSCWPET